MFNINKSQINSNTIFQNYFLKYFVIFGVFALFKRLTLVAPESDGRLVHHLK